MEPVEKRVALTKRTPVQVVQSHLDAVRKGEPHAMAADYAADARLDRPGASWTGREQVAAYFRSVPTRLAGGTVDFTDFDPLELTVSWRIVGGPGHGTRGTDRYEVRNGLIARQTVYLDGGTDF